MKDDCTQESIFRYHSLTDFGHMVYKLEDLIFLTVLLEVKVYCYVFQTVCHDLLDDYEINLVVKKQH